MRIFWSYKSPEVYKLVSLAPKRGREKGKGGREKEGRRKTGRREGGKRKKQQQQQSRFQSSLSQRELRHSHSNFYSTPQTTFLDIFGFPTSAQFQQLNKSENTSPVHGTQTRDISEEPNIFCFGKMVTISFYLKEL